MAVWSRLNGSRMVAARPMQRPQTWGERCRRRCQGRMRSGSRWTGAPRKAMNFRCFVGLHEWRGCFCKVCGKTRHDWNGCVCRKCSAKRDELHEWDGCKCKKCGKSRKEGQHEWDGCRCKKCGQTRRDGEHDWDGCRCKKCHEKRNEGHDWDGCKCKRCGETRNEGHNWDDCDCRRCGEVMDGIGAGSMSHPQIVQYLRDIANAATYSSSAPAHLNSYEKRRAAARAIGAELNRRGRSSLMRKTLENDLGWCSGCRVIEGFWGGIGSWLA